MDLFLIYIHFGDSNYVGIFPVQLRMDLILTDFPIGSGF